MRRPEASLLLFLVLVGSAHAIIGFPDTIYGYGTSGILNFTNITLDKVCLPQGSPTCITSWDDVNVSGSGDITAVNAGTCLTGGGGSGSVTLNVNGTCLNDTLAIGGQGGGSGGSDGLGIVSFVANDTRLGYSNGTTTYLWLENNSITTWLDTLYYTQAVVDGKIGSVGNWSAEESNVRTSIVNNVTSANSSAKTSWEAFAISQAQGANSSARTYALAQAIAQAQGANASARTYVDGRVASIVNITNIDAYNSTTSDGNLSLVPGSSGTVFSLSSAFWTYFLTYATDNCATITGSAGLCDGDDAAGAGSFDLNITGDEGSEVVITDSEDLVFAGNGTANITVHTSGNTVTIEGFNTVGGSGESDGVGIVSFVANDTRLGYSNGTTTYSWIENATMSAFIAVLHYTKTQVDTLLAGYVATGSFENLTLSGLQEQDWYNGSQVNSSASSLIADHAASMNNGTGTSDGVGIESFQANDTRLGYSNGTTSYVWVENGTFTSWLDTLYYTQTILDGSFSALVNESDTTLSQEQVEDFAGGMWTGNTETAATVTYQDGDGTIDIDASLSLDSSPVLGGNMNLSGYNVSSGYGGLAISENSTYVCIGGPC